jgi:hemerythrin superfamily protein
MPHPFIDHLVKDHQKQREVGKKLREATDPQQRESLLQQFREALVPHMEGEEASIFAYMQGANKKSKGAAMEAVQEHNVARVLLHELMDMKPDDPVFSAKASVLDELNLHHMNEEEKKQFLLLVDKAGAKKLDALYEDYEAAEKKAKSG